MQDIEDAHNRFIFVEGNGSTTRTRRHVMRDIGKQRRSKDRPWISNVSRVRIPVHVNTAATAKMFGAIDEGSEEDQWPHQAHITHLGNFRLDPFASYPIPMDRRSLELIWYMFETSLPNNNAFYRSVWYPLAFSSAAAFHQILSMFPVYMKTTGLAHIVSEDDAYVLLHHNEAVRRVRESLENPESAASDDGILATITGMICQSHLTGDVEQWTAHVNALKSLVQLRGGAASLNCSPILGFSIRLVDMSTSFSQAKIPSLVTAPCLLEADIPTMASDCLPFFSDVASSWYARFPDSTEIMETLLRLWDMFSRLNLGIIQISDDPRDENCIWRFMHPVLDRLLRYRCPASMCEDRFVINEACRISGLLSLAQFRRMLGITPVSTTIYTSRAQRLVLQYQVDWAGLESLKLWILLTIALEAQDPSVHEQLAQEAGELVSMAKLDHVEKLQEEFANVMWVDSGSLRKLQSFWSRVTWHSMKSKLAMDLHETSTEFYDPQGTRAL